MTMIRELIERIQLTKDPRMLVPWFQRRSHKKGEALLHQGAVWDSAFFIEQGLLRVHIVGREGRDFNKSFWPEGTMIFPITEAMEGQPALFTISALEPAVVWHASVGELRGSLEGQGLWEPMRAELRGRLLDQKLRREHDLLTLDGTSRYRKLCEDSPQLAARVPLVHLASYLGLTDVSLSRIRRRLDEERG